MATITKSYTENSTSALASTWALTMTGANVSASSPTVEIPIPSLKAKYTTSAGKNRGRVNITCNLRNGTTNLLTNPITYKKERVATYNLTPMTSGTEYVTDTNYASSVVAVPISSLFTGNNPNERTVNINAVMTSMVLASGLLSSDSGTAALYNSYSSSTASAWGNILSVTLNVPPTFETTQATFDTNYVYSGLTTASVTVSDTVAYHGGNINEVRLTIGDQSVTRPDAGTLSMLLNAEGEFTPVVSVTDSRGQVTNTSLNKIYVNGYASPSIDFNDLDRVLGTYKLTEDNEVVANKAYYSRTGTGSTAHPFVYTQEHPVSPANPHTLGYYEETNAKGTEDDEGTSAVIEITPTFTRAITCLEEPTLQIDGETSASSNPPIAWYTDRALTNAVNWTDYKPAEGTHLYGYIADIFDTQQSYQIGLIPHDSIGDGTLKTQTLAPAFYTVDFLAGGHGIAFGQPCDEEGFWCNMEAHFVDANNVMRALLDLVHPVGSYYETSKTPTEFNPNNVWGGTWSLEIAGQVHVSGASSGTYEVKPANTDASNGDGTVGANQGGSKDAIVPYHNHGHTITYTQNSSGTCSIASSGAHVHTLNLRNAGTTGSRATNNVTYGASGHDYQNSNPFVSSGAHTHTVPNHTHTGSISGSISYAGTSGNTNNANMQPYIAVYRWHRTA